MLKRLEFYDFESIQRHLTIAGEKKVYRLFNEGDHIVLVIDYPMKEIDSTGNVLVSVLGSPKLMYVGSE